MLADVQAHAAACMPVYASWAVCTYQQHCSVSCDIVSSGTHCNVARDCSCHSALQATRCWWASSSCCASPSTSCSTQQPSAQQQLSVRQLSLLPNLMQCHQQHTWVRGAAKWAWQSADQPAVWMMDSVKQSGEILIAAAAVLLGLPQLLLVKCTLPNVVLAVLASGQVLFPLPVIPPAVVARQAV